MPIQHCMKATEYAQKIEREFLLVQGMQQKKINTVMSIDALASNDPISQQRLTNIALQIQIER